MSICETLVYGKRHTFVYLRYVAMAFLFLSQLATSYVVFNVLEHVGNALNALETQDVLSVITNLSSFRLSGTFGTVIEIMRNLGALVIPLYFIATISFVLDLNRGGIGKVILRTAVIAAALFVVEMIVYFFLVGLVTLLVLDAFAYITGSAEQVMGLLNKIIETLNAKTNILPVGNLEEAIAFAEDFAIMKLSFALLRNMPSFNIFLDLLLCLLMVLFFCCRPKWINTKVKLVVYRSMGLLPIAYIITTFIINGLVRMGTTMPDIMVMCFFPARSILHFFFIGCILLLHRMQPVFTMRLEKGLLPTHVRRKEYRMWPFPYETAAVAKKRALGAAIFLSVCILLLAGIDLSMSFLSFAPKWGFGKFYYAVFCIPFLFLYDDRKPTKKRDYLLFSIVYPIVITVIVLLYVFY